jgi:hypothetical protein
MSKEHANQQLRDNKGEPAGVVKVKEDDVKRLLRNHGNLSYVPVEDLRDLISSTARQLAPMANESNAEYAYGVEASVVMNILCSVVRVPKASEPTVDPKKFAELNTKAIEEYRKNHLKAAEIARVIHIDDTKNCTFEEYQKAIKNAGDEQAVKRILMRPKMDSTELSLPNSEPLPAFTPAPKSLSCAGKFKVKLEIQSVHTKEGQALVTLKEVEHGETTPLFALIDKDLKMVFGTRKKQTKRVLIAMQLLEHPIQCTVGATIALRNKDFNHNNLAFISFFDDKSQHMEIAQGLKQMSWDF